MINSTAIQACGLKATPQRLLILKHIEKAGHISIEQLFDAVQREFPSISLATVYKNIDALLAAGLIREVGIVRGKHVFEIAKEDHIHFICKRCGTVTDIRPRKEILPESLTGPLPGEKEMVELNIYGICNSCKNET
ncbi:MAG: transcriptional repressor [Acidobacteria bacterium]|nr:transcriptional repressor [Acidobacteriota bacterium]